MTPFSTKFGANSQQWSQFVFSRPAWLRSLIRPKPGTALAHVNLMHDEFGIGAGLAEDPEMLAAYRTGDPYLATAVRLELAPASAERETHGMARKRAKQAWRVNQFGLGAETLARRTGQPLVDAQALLQRCGEIYSTYSRWTAAATERAAQERELRTALGWRLGTTPTTPLVTFLEFPLTANRAEILRLTCNQVYREGIRVCAILDDGLLIEADSTAIYEVAMHSARFMREASAAVINGQQLLTNAEFIRHPNRFRSNAGSTMWTRVAEFLDSVTA